MRHKPPQQTQPKRTQSTLTFALLHLFRHHTATFLQFQYLIGHMLLQQIRRKFLLGECFQQHLPAVEPVYAAIQRLMSPDFENQQHFLAPFPAHVGLADAELLLVVVLHRLDVIGPGCNIRKVNIFIRMVRNKIKNYRNKLRNLTITVLLVCNGCV